MEIYGPNDPETKKINKIILLEHEKLYDEKVKQLIKEIKEINDIMKFLDVPQEILEKEIKPFGNASHIILPKEYAKRTAKIIIKR